MKYYHTIAGKHMDAKKVGKTIAFLRSQYGLTQRNLADYLGVTDKAVSRWERGMGVPDISLLSRLSIILDTDIESILEGNITHSELKWKGVLNLSYSEAINASTRLFDKPAICFQLSLFMLVGINEICVRGCESDIEYAKDSIGNSSRYGLNIIYMATENPDLDSAVNSDYFTDAFSNGFGVMIISGLDFIYGKDVTKNFRRVIYDDRFPVQFTNFNSKPTSIYFFPNTTDTKAMLKNNTLKMNYRIMERGIITFPLKTDYDILNASNLISIIEQYQGEKVADLNAIAQRRNITAF